MLSVLFQVKREREGVRRELLACVWNVAVSSVLLWEGLIVFMEAL